MKRRDFLSVAALATTLGVSGAGMSAWASSLPAHPFYQRSFPDVTGKQHELVGYLGKPLVLNFWATWCPPCVKEMPDLEALHQKYPGITIVGLATDTASNVIKFGDKVTVSYPLLVAGHGGIALMRDLGNDKGGLPFTVIFNADGQINKHILGQVDPAELDAMLASLL